MSSWPGECLSTGGHLCSASHISPVHPVIFFPTSIWLCLHRMKQLVMFGCIYESCFAHSSSGTDLFRSDLLPEGLKTLQSSKIHVRKPPLIWPLNVAINKFSAVPVFNRKACLLGTTRLILCFGPFLFRKKRLCWALQETFISLLFFRILSLEISPWGRW